MSKSQSLAVKIRDQLRSCRAAGLLWLAIACLALDLRAAHEGVNSVNSRRLAQDGEGGSQLPLPLRQAGVLTSPFPFGVTVTPTEAFSPQRTFVFPFACPPTKGDTIAINQAEPGEVPSPGDEFADSNQFPGAYSVITRDRGEVFVLGGINLQTGNSTRPYLAKVDTTTMQQIWRTYLQDDPLAWQTTGSMALDSNRNVIASFGNRIVKVDGSDDKDESGQGKILQVQPFIVDIENASPENTGHTGFVMMSDGNIITKSLHKDPALPGCNTTTRGSALRCLDKGVNGTITLLDGNNITNILYNVAMPEPSTARLSSTVHKGREYVYYVGILGNVYRYLYNSTAEDKLSLDESWAGKLRGMPSPSNGKIADFGTAAIPLNGWIVSGSNGVPSNGSYVLNAIWEADALISHELVAFPDWQGESWGPTSVTVDPESNLVFANDFLACRIGAFRLTAGGFERVWEVPQCSTDFITLLGPPENRVLASTNITDIPGPKPSFSKLLNYTYKSQNLIFRDAKTGEEIARTPEVGITGVMPHAPGYDGDYFMLAVAEPFNLTRFSYDTHGCTSQPAW